MFISRKTIRPRTKKIMADTEMDIEEETEAEVTVDPEVSELLFEAEDVAELVAEVTGSPVDVSADGDTIVFEVNGDEFKVEAEGDEEIVESSTRAMKKDKRVRKPIASGTKRGRMIKRIK